MKSFSGFYLEVGTMEQLRLKAQRAGAPLSALADLCVRYTLDKLDDAALAKWAASRPSSRGRLGGGMRKVEQTCLATLQALVEEERRKGASDPVNHIAAWRISADEIAAHAGMTHKDAFLALSSLKLRGLIEGMHWGEEIDRWGRPLKSLWWLPAAQRR